MELRRVIADGLRELGVLLFGQRLNLFLLVVPVLDVLHHCGGRGLIDFIIGAGKVAVQAGKDTVQFLNLSIRHRVLKLLGRLRDCILEGRASLRRVVGNRDKVTRRIDDGRKRFVLVDWPLDSLAARRLEAGSHVGVDPGVVKGQCDSCRRHWIRDFRGSLARLKAFSSRSQWRTIESKTLDGLPNSDSWILELAQLVAERGDLLHLVLNHFNVFSKVLGLVQNLLHIRDRVIDDPLRAGGERQRQSDEGGD